MPASGRRKEESHQWAYLAMDYKNYNNSLLLIGFAVTLQHRAHAWPVNLVKGSWLGRSWSLGENPLLLFC